MTAADTLDLHKEAIREFLEEYCANLRRAKKANARRFAQEPAVVGAALRGFLLGRGLSLPALSKAFLKDFSQAVYPTYLDIWKRLGGNQRTLFRQAIEAAHKSGRASVEKNDGEIRALRRCITTLEKQFQSGSSNHEDITKLRALKRKLRRLEPMAAIVQVAPRRANLPRQNYGDDT